MGKKKGQSHEDPAAPSSIAELAYSVPSHGGSGPYVLVEAEEVVGVVAALERLEPVVLPCPVGLANTLLSLLHEEVHVDARVVGLQRRPEVPGPLPLLVEALYPSVAPVMLYVCPAMRPPKAVSSSPTRASAPPRCQSVKAENGELIRNA